VSCPKVIYRPRADVTSASELNALVVVYRFILDCHANKQDRPTTSGPDDAKEITSVRARPIVPEEP
jgi:hypothetical protein